MLTQSSMLEKLIFLYGKVKGKEVEKRLKNIINEAKTKVVCEDRPFWDEKDIFLITYPDSFYEKETPVLQTLDKFLQFHLRGGISGVHILPFYPFSSDRGFSVTNYYQVEKEFGTWGDVEKIGKRYRLMADLVLNHVSVKHEWFQKFLAGEEKYWDYFIHFDKVKIPQEALKKVFRPRSAPILTPFETAKGERWAWTTFSVENSTDQVDLNYQNSEILIEVIKILLFLLQKGVRIIRLDSIPYIWKELGTDCKNLPKTHTIVSIFRNVLDLVCPGALIVTQSSLPFGENISYFGNKEKEAQLVYNFALPPLLLEAFYSRNSKYLNQLAEKMSSPDKDCSFLNILAVHDGVGINGAKDFLNEAEINNLCLMAENKGGKLSYRSLPEGGQTVVEINITWWSALNNPLSSLGTVEPFEIQLKRFISSYAIAFSMRGIPAVYYLSLIGAENNYHLFQKTKIKRDLNRTNLDLRELEVKFWDKSSKEFKVLAAMKNLISKRKLFSAFHPGAKQVVLNLDKRVFSLLRGDGNEKVLALHNLSNEVVALKYNSRLFKLDPFSYIWTKT